MNTRVKVPRLTLIERIKAVIAEEQAKSETEMEAFAKKIAKIEPIVRKQIATQAAQIAAMSGDELVRFIMERRERYRTFFIEVDVDIPYVQRPYDPSYDERMLRILEASTDETISVSTRDGLYQYL